MDQYTNEDLNLVNQIINANNVYEVLGVRYGEGDKTILKKRYRKLSLTVHPDKNHAPNAVKAFQRINESYTTLCKSPLKPQITGFTTKTNFHEDRRGKCHAINKDGRNCMKIAIDGKQYCSIHSNYDSNKHAEPPKPKVDKRPCAAKTKANKSCLKNASEGSQYCNIHRDYDPNKPPESVKVRCKATTKSGNTCSKNAKEGSEYCGIHSK